MTGRLSEKKLVARDKATASMNCIHGCTNWDSLKKVKSKPFLLDMLRPPLFGALAWRSPTAIFSTLWGTRSCVEEIPIPSPLSQVDCLWQCLAKCQGSMNWPTESTKPIKSKTRPNGWLQLSATCNLFFKSFPALTGGVFISVKM